MQRCAARRSRRPAGRARRADRSGSRKPQSTTAAQSIVAVLAAEAVLDVDRSGVRRRAAASGARSAPAPGRAGRWPAPDRRVRLSSLPAMWSCVTSTARVAELLGEGDARSVRRSGRTRRSSPVVGQRRPRPRAHVGDVEHGRRRRSTSYAAIAGPRSGRTARPRPRSARRRSSAEADVDAERARISAASQSTSGRSGPATAASTAERSARSTSVDVVPAAGGDACRLQPGRTAAEHDDALGGARRARTSPGPRSRGRCVGSPMHVTIGLRASRTWHVWLQRMHGRIASASPSASLATRSGIGDLGPRHLDRVAHADRRRRRAPTRPARRRRPNPGGHTRDVDGRSGRTVRHSVDVEPGRLVEVGPGLLGGEDRAPHDDDVVEPEADELGRDGRRLLGRDARPRRELVARQPQPDDAVAADGGADRLDHLSRRTRSDRDPTRRRAGS